MFNRLIRHPVFYTVVGTLFSIAISYVVTSLTMMGAGTPLPTVALFLVLGLPAAVAPITMYPLLVMLKRQRLLRVELERLVLTDMLTELPNRRAFFAFARAAFEATPAAEAPLTAMMIDVDHFKRINDSYGHDVGDTVLKRVAGVIRDEVAAAGASNATVARIGGEEFAVIADRLSPSAVARLADRICGQVHRWVGAGEALEPVTVSVGVAFRTGAMGIDRLLKEADDAVYAAKRNGRDRWAFASDKPASTATRRAPRPQAPPAEDRLAAG